MKATDVRILEALEPGESYVEPNFLLVETATDDHGEVVTTIEHVTSEQRNGKDGWKITTLGQSVAMSHAAALEWAVSFAALRNVPVVYERDESAAAYAAQTSGASQSASASK